MNYLNKTIESGLFETEYQMVEIPHAKNYVSPQNICSVGGLFKQEEGTGDGLFFRICWIDVMASEGRLCSQITRQREYV